MAAYAVCGSKWLASTIETFWNGCHVRRRDFVPLLAAVSRELDLAVIRAGPYAVDVQRRRRNSVNHAARRWLGCFLIANLPMLAGTAKVGRVRSGEICCQLCPPLMVFHRVLVAK